MIILILIEIFMLFTFSEKKYFDQNSILRKLSTDIGGIDIGYKFAFSNSNLLLKNANLIGNSGSLSSESILTRPKVGMYCARYRLLKNLKVLL